VKNKLSHTDRKLRRPGCKTRFYWQRRDKPKKTGRTTTTDSTASMRTPLHAVLRLAFTVAPWCAAPACQLHVQADVALEEFVEHSKSVLTDAAPNNAHDLMRFVAANLRLGRLETARSLLQTYRGQDAPDLILIAHATFQRATGQLVLEEKQLRHLEDALTRAEGLPARSFCSAALLVHGRYCLGQISSAQSRSRHERLATTRLLSLEAETWQPGRGHYRPTPCNGELRVPEAADASLLIPHSFGMLIATGNRLQRHLTSTLRAQRSGSWRRWQADICPDQFPALRLLAAALLGDRDETEAAYHEVLQQHTSDPSLAALQLEAVMQALTGIRIAASAGHDGQWLRMQPWLPNACDAMELRGLYAQQHNFAIELRRDRVKDAIRVAVAVAPPERRQLKLMVANRWQQHVANLSPEQPFRCELPATSATGSKPDHDTQHRLRLRRR
jgi:hypothetical protein